MFERIYFTLYFTVRARLTHHVNTASSEERTSLLVHIFDSESVPSNFKAPATNTDSIMASNKGGIQPYESPVVGNGQSYDKSADLNEHSSDSMGMDRRGDSDDTIDPEVLGDALHALENKKTVWYAYLTTKDFWIVLLLG